MSNQFNELCFLASKNKWCWSLYCTTCGHQDFRWAFQEMANGNPKFDDDWAPSKEKSFPYFFTKKEKQNIISKCLDARISEISKRCLFPDWLGYLGLVIYHTKSSGPEYRLLSKKWRQELIELTPQNLRLLEMFPKLANHDELLDIEDLESFETILGATFKLKNSDFN